MNRLRRLPEPLLVLALLAIFHSWYAFHALGLFDVGVMLDGAVRTQHGELFLRDFIAPYGPLRYWILGAAFAGFGAPLTTWFVISILLQAVAGAWLYDAARRLAGRTPAALVTVLLALAHGSMHKGFLLLAMVVALTGAWLAGSLDRRRIWLGGAAAGTAFLLRYDVGGFALLAGVLALAAMDRGSWRHRAGRLLCFAGGFLLVVVPVFLLLIVAGGSAPDWWALTWQRIAVQERIHVPFPWPTIAGGLRPGRLGPFLLFSAALLLHVSWLGGALSRRTRGRALPGDAARVASALFGLLALNQARLIPSTNHVFQSLLPAFLAAADLVGRAPRRRLKTGVLAVATLCTAGFVHTSTSGPYPGSYTTRTPADQRVSFAAGAAWLPAAEAQDLKRVVAEIRQRTAPGVPLAFGPSCALLCVLADRPPAIPFAEPSYYYRNDRFQRQVVDALQSNRAPLFVLDRRPTAGFFFHTEAPLLYAYLTRTYRPVGEFGPYQLFERIP